MNIKKSISSSFLLKSIFAISLFILIFISGITYKHNLSLAESTNWVVHTLKANVQLEKLFSYVKDTESAQRGFIITRDSVYFQSYHQARQKVIRSFSELKELADDSPEQKLNLDTLYQLITARLTQMEVSLRIISESPFYQDFLNTSMSIGKGVMDKMYIQVNKMIALEMVYLKERQAKYEHKISFAPFFTMLLLFFALVVFIFSYWRINKDIYVLQAANARLLINAEAMAHAEEIGAFSNWQWNLETGKLIYSDNQYRLLGVDPQSFEPTIEKFLEFVHPQDKHIITQGANQVVNENTYPVAYFRIIRKDGEIRHFKSLSKIITDANGRKLLIGINADVTEQQKNLEAVEERNFELEQRNKELASFNHVASHDLQEPLRIVQTYISRFNDKETAVMTDKGKEYFSKIKIAVTRMRVLIDDLLLFSRATRMEKRFELSDLNHLLQDAEMDLAELISQSNAEIESVPLPTLKVIPFQIQQLFTNLIGNSIKYRRPGVRPLIRITCERINASAHPDLKAESNRKFEKISITDNGIGFDQQYAETIFTLFQRLHLNNQYEGTGIGLAICKKIVDNHGGIIKAEGNPNIGSTFSIFLPAS